VTCINLAECRIDCTGATNCGFASCTGGQSTCPDGSIVCRMACP
jgi:hypothetical protein